MRCQKGWENRPTGQFFRLNLGLCHILAGLEPWGKLPAKYGGPPGQVGIALQTLDQAISWNNA
jgi:hypothetical protein